MGRTKRPIQAEFLGMSLLSILDADWPLTIQEVTINSFLAVHPELAVLIDISVIYKAN